jgi:hypothetical protein
VFTDGQRQPNHNTTTYCVMWSCYDWVVVVVFRLLTQHVVILWMGCRCLPSVNTICGRIINTTTYYVYWRTTTTINPIIIRPHCMFTDRRQQRQPIHNTTTWSYYDCIYCCFRSSVSTICGRIMIGLSLLSVSKHTMWSYYDWVYCCCRPSVNTTLYVYWQTTTITQS